MSPCVGKELVESLVDNKVTLDRGVATRVCLGSGDDRPHSGAPRNKPPIGNESPLVPSKWSGNLFSIRFGDLLPTASRNPLSLFPPQNLTHPLALSTYWSILADIPIRYSMAT